MNEAISKLVFTANTWSLKQRALTITATDRSVFTEKFSGG